MAVDYEPTPLPGCEALAEEPNAAAEPDARETATDWTTGEVFPVHPAAAMFPMLAPEELEDLAADIREQGLLQAVVLDANRQLIDGRNRLAACAVAEVEPHYATLPPGVDPVAYILSLNVQRRHLNQSQRAMAVVLGAEVSTGGHFGHSERRDLAQTIGAQRGRLSEAALVARYAPDLGPLVLAGAEILAHAYEEAKRRRDDQALRDTEAERVAASLARIQRDAPDLAALVAEERVSLTEALAGLNQREAEARQREQAEQERRERTTAEFARSTARLHAILHDPKHDIVDDWTPAANPMAGIAGLEELWTATGLAAIVARLAQVAEAWPAEQEES